MRTLKINIVVFAAIAIMASTAALAFAQAAPGEIQTTVSQRNCDQVVLSYTGGCNIEEAFPVGEVMDVYVETHAFGLNANQKVDQVKILGYEGDHHVKAQLSEGRIRPCDVVALQPAPASTPMCAYRVH